MPIGAREEGPENGGTPAPLAPESKVQGLQTPTVGYALCCALADRPGGSWHPLSRREQGPELLSLQTKNFRPLFSCSVARDARTGPL